MSYKIYTGFVDPIDPVKYADKSAQEFFDLWYANTRKYYEDAEVVILGPDSPDIANKHNIKVLETYDNLGHVGDYIHNRKHGRWCGWTSAVVFGMMHAYVKNVDFIYKEQDCLAFGNYIQRMYNDCEGFDIAYGSCRVMGVAQSLFLVKRNAIPDIISSLAYDEDKVVLPEIKFARLPVKQTRLSFGYDRDRPWNPTDSEFYIQQISTQDFTQLEAHNLV
jgi:hypothetical protein